LNLLFFSIQFHLIPPNTFLLPSDSG
jgi:hypothetical protein